MSSRHKARETAFQFLYRQDMEDASQLASDVESHFNHFKTPDDLRDFARKLVLGTVQKKQEIDELIQTHASRWKVPRMPLVDRNLLRMAVYELMEFTDTPTSVIINEAVVLAKNFGTAETSSFINGILDTLAQEIRKSG